MFFTAVATIVSAVAVASATEDSCLALCNKVDGCKTAKYGSYCKAWKEPAVCFGLVRRDDGSYCFQPTDKDCSGASVSCDAGVIPTTVAPATTTITTAAPVTTTTSTTSKSAIATTTTAKPVTTSSTTQIPITTTTTATTSPTTVKSTTNTQAPTTTPTTTTTTAKPTTTTQSPTTTTTTTTTTATPSTTTSTTTTTTTTTKSTTTTQAPTTTTTTTTPVFGGHFCGKVMGQSFDIDFTDGHATINVAGMMKMHADYKVNGSEMEFFNYDATLTKLMKMMHIDAVKATIVDANDVHVTIGSLIDTTVTRC
ncbi:conserved hypothetical protein [Perkinsus marinus ATCC 50983]|uniref:Merozoite surface protein 2 n=1 Tax=Perkinsus marinus (strain ATCC 50983 / TXsc) TaxID=423536 RepID=C5LST4_PERM5|nr:conserved hypothetical protein [Perkinsus marinus ATCC 50983]EER00325.1 conserved hypothetical protein [Perkinsus marinus ATCC 50983]|eukprot:XP_002767607.1 conserved hypothetical protein [Perkinsus marinus ATCC 50983]